MTHFPMLLLCLGGMALGLSIDCRSTPPELLASLCLGSDRFLASVAVHWTVLPATHGLMVLGAFVAVVLTELMEQRTRSRNSHDVVLARRCASAACLTAMCAGMAVGGKLGAQVSASLGLSSFVGLTVAMTFGMVLGEALISVVYGQLRRHCARFGFP